ncbi:hypothetical protein RRG08_038636 [Elysia crispata]|uniref:Uncharacterized protein n=1 Tax=Elysia crispata TaxID=231223 RepID=A0AAE0YKI7_9GAST|nr:hypothetical protein RRG08_038636 [Elysia crispata]
MELTYLRPPTPVTTDLTADIFMVIQLHENMTSLPFLTHRLDPCYGFSGCLAVLQNGILRNLKRDQQKLVATASAHVPHATAKRRQAKGEERQVVRNVGANENRKQGRLVLFSLYREGPAAH